MDKTNGKTQEDLNLLDLIDVEVLQKIQDAFSEMTGMAALTTDKDGKAVTNGSNFTDFCMKYTRRSELGNKLCGECDKLGAETTNNRGKPCSYYCHAGLIDFAAPIVANDQIVGCFIGGQVLTSPPDLNKTAQIAEKLDIDPFEYADAVQRVNIIEKEKIDKAAEFLYLIASVLSSIAYKSYVISKHNMEMEKVSNMKSDFLANMSHEIRTPMNAVLGMADLALREEMSPKAREFIHQIKTSSKNLLVIINDILDFSKIESGKMEIVSASYEPLSLINDLSSIINSRIGNKKIEFTMDISPDLPMNLYGDNVRIHQIILNLLTNAVKFTQHGEVHLKIDFQRITSGTGIMKVSVSDTGIGIKEEDMHKLFNSFQQVDSKRNRNIEGTGLGLAISQQLLHLMNGKISVDSEYEKGSTFSFELPQKILNPAPCVPKPVDKVSAAILCGNPYVKRQLVRDLEWADAEYIDLEKSGSVDKMNCKCDYIIVERPFFSQTIQDFLTSNPDTKCFIVENFASTEDINFPGVRILHKPVYSLNLYNAMGLAELPEDDSSSEADSFTFIAPDANILIVDDNAINLTVAKGLLDPLKMNVDTAVSAAEGIDMLHMKQYDIIFMDHMMPEVDGIEATHIIRRLLPNYNDVPIIALTANAIGGAKEMFISEGMNDFVAKPIEVKNIVSKIRKWLPQEKICIPDKSEAAAMQAKQDKKPLSIAGLNTAEAVQRLGSEDLYLTVLKEYYRSIDKKAELVRKYLAEKKWHDYTVEVHSLKSTSKQIGADLVSTLAFELEKAGNAEDIITIEQKTEPMLTEYLKYKSILAEVFPEEAPKESAGGNGAVLKQLEKVQVALDNMDTLQIDEELEKLSSFKIKKEDEHYLEELKKSAGECDLDKCSEMIEEWGKKLMETASAETLPPDKIREMLSGVKKALDDFDVLDIEEAINEMSKYSYPRRQAEYLEELRNAVSESDIDLCEEIVNKWLREPELRAVS
jgi:signal transduction histidine kinase/DNA-binding response OmpR family regulator